MTDSQASPAWLNEGVAVLGAGLMGKQLALFFAAKGIPVRLWNHRPHPDLAATLRRMLRFDSRRLKLAIDLDETLARITCSDQLEDTFAAGLIIEAVLEDEAVKKELLGKLSPCIAPVVSSVTSSKSITDLASSFADPARFLGLHFLNPVMDTPLVEVVRGAHTADETLQAACDALAPLGRQPVVIQDSPGFVVNRILFPMINEAIHVLEEQVADAETVDACMKSGSHHPMGPLELADFIGLDTCLRILETLAQETGNSKYQPAPLLRKQVRAGKLGRKSGEGFFTYRKRST